MYDESTTPPVTIEHLKEIITKAHMSGTFKIQTYVPEVKYFTEMLPIAIPTAMISKLSIKPPFRIEPRASEIAIHGVRRTSRKIRKSSKCSIVTSIIPSHLTPSPGKRMALQKRIGSFCCNIR